ncbi:MAG: CDP-alcohol phosphatidyltransferase family protein [Bacteroidetes bacterium]|nr:CDP-alcohol phosphatidyltransferase family protein [Bacteroidota bacterium]
MRHLPNLLTLANLFCGCLALVCILNAQPFLFQTPSGDPDLHWSWSYGVTQMQWGGALILLAAVFDLLDGFVARALKVFSPIGADLDSLADVVSFGVAPSAILYMLLWDCVSREPMVTDVSMWATAPAFLLACFAALRLARFNVMPIGSKGFQGMPTPAVGLLIASLALVSWDKPAGWTAWLFGSRWALYALIALLCYLMVSGIRFMKLMPAQWKLTQAWPQALLVLATLISIPWLRFGAIPLAFVLYVVLSFVPGKAQPAS